MKRERINIRINLFSLIIAFLVIKGVINTLTQRPAILIAALIVSTIISILIVKNRTISSTIAIIVECERIEGMYEDLEKAEKEGFYKVEQGQKQFEVSLSERERNIILDNIIKRCDSFINNKNIKGGLSRRAYKTSISTVKTIKNLAEKKKEST